MSVPAFLKSGPFLASAGAVATGVAGIGGWQLMDFGESKESPMYMPFSSENKPDLSQLKFDKAKIAFGKYDCFNKFFNRVNVDVQHHHDLDSNNQDQTIDTSSEDELKISSPKNTSGQDPVGCAMLNLSYDLKKDDPYWGINAEFAVKNDKVGWVLWAVGEGRMEGEDSAKQYSQNLRYRLVFLEWENGEWNVRGGYYWKDSGMTTTSSFNLKVSVATEGEWINKNYSLDESGSSFSGLTQTDSQLNNRTFAGTWSVEAVGKEIFEEMVISSSADSEHKEGILGKSGGFEDSELEVISAYKLEEKKWISYKKKDNDSWAVKAKDVLKAWYLPFQGKKGKWTKLN